MLQDGLGFSERRACRYVGQPRSAAVGYRQAHQHLLDEGWSINRKRTPTLWREEGLRVPTKRRKRQRRAG